MTRIPSIVDQNKGRIEAEVFRRLEREPALPNVPLVLFGIEVDTHTSNCTYKLTRDVMRLLRQQAHRPRTIRQSDAS
jgi:hypothetical protein